MSGEQDGYVLKIAKKHGVSVYGLMNLLNIEVNDDKYMVEGRSYPNLA